MKKYLIITADTNDADYITNKVEVTEELLTLVMPVIEAIKDFKQYEIPSDFGFNWKHNHNFPEGDCLREDLGEKSTKEMYGHLEGFEEFRDMVPMSEYGIHTITSIELFDVAEGKRLL